MEKKSLKILVASFGSRGDSQPMIGLTKALRQAGHDAVFQGPLNAKDLAEKFDVPFIQLAGDPEAILKAPGINEILAKKEFLKLVELKEWQESYGSIGEEILEAAKDRDLLLTVAGITANCWLVHKKCGIPLIVVSLQPMFPTGAFGYISDDPDPWRKDEKLNRESWDNGFKATLEWFGPVIQKYEKVWNIKIPTGPFGFWHDIFDNKVPFIGGYSKEAINGRPSDWPDHVQISGYFDVDSDDSAKLSEEITSFLEKDPSNPPVFISFGSMAFADPKVLLNLALAIVEKLGRRVIMSAGWTTIDNTDVQQNEKLLKIQGAPYDLLFPKCSVIIHHGGAGTTGAALKSGRPQVVIPFFTDQPFNGSAMYKIGVSGKPVNYYTLKEEDVLEGVKYCDKEEVIRKAEEVGKKVREEDGKKEVAKLVEKFWKDMKERKD